MSGWPFNPRPTVLTGVLGSIPTSTSDNISPDFRFTHDVPYYRSHKNCSGWAKITYIITKYKLRVGPATYLSIYRRYDVINAGKQAFSVFLNCWTKKVARLSNCFSYQISRVLRNWYRAPLSRPYLILEIKGRFCCPDWILWSLLLDTWKSGPLACLPQKLCC